MNVDVSEHIAAHVRATLSRLQPQERSWFEGHMVTPRLVQLSNSISGPETIEAWLVTDHTGADDASYRIVYRSEDDLFGYECTLEGDREYFVGQVGTLADAIEGL